MFQYRWINLWWPADIAEGVVSDSCAFDKGVSDIGALVFVGNFALVVIILSSIFLLHVMVISGVEAFWMAKVRMFYDSNFVLFASSRFS